MIIHSRVPVRIDFAGAWTDVKIFADGAGGAVVNAAIDKYVEGRLEIRENNKSLKDNLEGINVSYHSQLPAGSGLGTSSALNVCWLSLVQSQIHPSAEYREQVAELAFNLEEMLGILGGKQDQYASALGGINYLEFGTNVKVEPLNLTTCMIDAMECSLTLCYTGKSRLSSSIHENVWSAFRQGNPATVNALYSLRAGAMQMRLALLDDKIEEFGKLIGDSWTHQKALDTSVTNNQIEELFKIAKLAGAKYGKACGAGGGGCLLFFSDPDRKVFVERALKSSGVRVIPFSFENTGLSLSVE